MYSYYVTIKLYKIGLYSKRCMDYQCVYLFMFLFILDKISPEYLAYIDGAKKYEARSRIDKRDKLLSVPT